MPLPQATRLSDVHLPCLTLLRPNAKKTDLHTRRGTARPVPDRSPRRRVSPRPVISNPSVEREGSDRQVIYTFASASSANWRRHNAKPLTRQQMSCASGSRASISKQPPLRARSVTSLHCFLFGKAVESVTVLFYLAGVLCFANSASGATASRKGPS